MFELPQKKQKIRGAYVSRVVDEVNRNHIIAGRGIALRRTPAGTVIDCTAVGVGKASIAGGLKPWAVRWHEPPPAQQGGTQPDGQWEVYLPPGTLTIRSSCYVMNDPASNTTGHDDEANWFVIPLNEGSASGETEFRIVAHGKPSVMMNSGGGEYTVESPFVAVTAEPSSATDPTSDSQLATHYFGDSWNTVIATVTVTRTTSNNVTTVTRSVLQIAKATVNVNADTPTYFRPVWQMTWDGSSAAAPLSVDAIHLEERTLYVGGVATVAPDVNLSVTNAGYHRIYLTIDTSGTTPTAALSTVQEEPTDAPLPSTATSQPIILFEMYNKRVTVDLRQNLANLPYYRGLA